MILPSYSDFLEKYQFRIIKFQIFSILKLKVNKVTVENSVTLNVLI